MRLSIAATGVHQRVQKRVHGHKKTTARSCGGLGRRGGARSANSRAGAGKRAEAQPRAVRTSADDAARERAAKEAIPGKVSIGLCRCSPSVWRQPYCAPRCIVAGRARSWQRAAWSPINHLATAPPTPRPPNARLHNGSERAADTRRPHEDRERLRSPTPAAARARRPEPATAPTNAPQPDPHYRLGRRASIQARTWIALASTRIFQTRQAGCRFRAWPNDYLM
jgi:hypothetical protein